MNKYNWKEEGVEYRTYRGAPIRKGIDDLKCIHPWGPTAQGDTSYADRIEDSNDWLAFQFDECDEHDAEGIKLAIANRIKWNEDYIAELKRTGEYGKETEGITLILQYNPMIDEPNRDKSILGNYSFDIFDFSKDAETKI